MQDSKRQRQDEGVIDADATSKETLEDLEKKEQSSDSEPSKSQTPSPDGALDEPDEIKGAGPV